MFLPPPFLVRYLPHILATLTVLGAVWWAYSTVWERGYVHCKTEYIAQAAEAAAAARQDYLDAVARGNEISAKLAAAQAENRKLRSRHADQARAILGVCPDGLRQFHDAAATGVELPTSSGASLGSSGLVAASAIAAAVGENYADCRSYIDQLNALIDWHEQRN